MTSNPETDPPMQLLFRFLVAFGLGPLLGPSRKAWMMGSQDFKQNGWEITWA